MENKYQDYYEHCWVRIRNELQDLTARDVRGISPHIVMRYMDFIELVEANKIEKAAQE